MRLGAVAANRLALALTKPQVVDNPGTEQENEQCAGHHCAAGTKGDVAKHVQEGPEHAHAGNGVGKIDQPVEHSIRLYRGFVVRGFAGKALLERIDYRFHLRAERSLDHDNIAGAYRGDGLGFETGRALGIAAPFTRGKRVPQVAHQRTTTIHQIDVIGLDGLIETAMQRGAGWAEFEHIAEHRDAPAVRADRSAAEYM